MKKSTKLLIYPVFMMITSLSHASPLTSAFSNTPANQDSTTDINTFDAKAFCAAVCKDHPEKGGVLCHCDEPPME